LESINTTLRGLKDNLELFKQKILDIKELTIRFENDIPHNEWGALITRINNLKKKTVEEFDHLIELLHEFECKLRIETFDDKLKEAQSLVFGKLHDLNNNHDICHGRCQM